MNHQEQMIKALSALLEEGETLLYPVYGTLKQKNGHFFGYFGLTENCLLVALLQGDSKAVGWTARAPLDIKKVIVKKGLFPLFLHIRIEFNEGDPVRLQASRTVYGIADQAKNLEGFIHFVQTH